MSGLKISKLGTDREKTDREKTDREKTDREKTDREKTDREKTSREKTSREKTDREKTSREKTSREKTDREKSGRSKTRRLGADRLGINKLKIDRHKIDRLEKKFIYICKNKKQTVIKKREMDGSYTIEASLILFFILCIMLGLLYAGFYEHDRQVIETVCVKELNNELNYIQECSGRKDGITDWEVFTNKKMLWRILDTYSSDELITSIKEKLSGALLCSSVPEITADIERESISLTFDSTFRFPGKWISNLFTSGTNMQISGTIKEEEREAEEFVRLCRALKKQ